MKGPYFLKFSGAVKCFLFYRTFITVEQVWDKSSIRRTALRINYRKSDLEKNSFLFDLFRWKEKSFESILNGYKDLKFFSPKWWVRHLKS